MSRDTELEMLKPQDMMPMSPFSGQRHYQHDKIREALSLLPDMSKAWAEECGIDETDERMIYGWPEKFIDFYSGYRRAILAAAPPSPGTLHGELRNPIREWDDAVQTGHMALASHPAPDPGMREAVARVACESWGYDWETENSAHKAGWREMIDRIMALVGAGGLRAAAEKLYDACLLADVRGELAENIDGSLLDAVQLALGRTPPQKQSWICPTCGPVPDDLVVKRNGKYRHYRQPVVSDGELCGPVQKQGDAP